ncbi:hypothetical protein TrispH2_010668 [Trichoplax sp. H2]|nr:hypothetical protein TrispH2_010668 [Trichoplax sp. H2]|eukprot:RDD37939.1 hypothetical protein TrispH2_010668 [Trichoplax sp. H2]
MNSTSMKILISALLLTIIVESQCRRVLDIDLDDIEMPYKSKNYGKNKFNNYSPKDEQYNEDEVKPTTPSQFTEATTQNETQATCHRGNSDCSDGMKCCNSLFRCYRIMGRYVCTTFLMEGLGAFKASQESERDDTEVDFW